MIFEQVGAGKIFGNWPTMYCTYMAGSVGGRSEVSWDACATGV